MTDTRRASGQTAHPRLEGDGQTIGQRIRRARKRVGLNQGQLADRLGVTQPTVANWEAGVHDPRQLVLGKLAEALGVSLGWLAGGETPQAERPAARIPDYIRLGVRHVPILDALGLMRVRAGEDAHALASDYLPFAHQGGQLLAMRLPADALPPGIAPGTLLIADVSRTEPEPGALVVACEASGPVARAWRPGGAPPTGVVVASIRFH